MRGWVMKSTLKVWSSLLKLETEQEGKREQSVPGLVRESHFVKFRFDLSGCSLTLSLTVGSWSENFESHGPRVRTRVSRNLHARGTLCRGFLEPEGFGWHGNNLEWERHSVVPWERNLPLLPFLSSPLPSLLSLSPFPSLPTSLTPSLSVCPSTHRKCPLSRLTVATRLSPIVMAVSVFKCVQGKVWWNLVRNFHC